MPNWANTTYICEGDEKQIQELNEILQTIDKSQEPILQSDFGKWWLGNLVHLLGKDWQCYSCRGTITDFKMRDKSTIVIKQETAWAEQGGVRNAIEDRFPGIKVYYSTEEFEMSVFETNDVEGRYFPERIVLISNEGLEYFADINSLAEHVKKMIGRGVVRNINSINMALAEYCSQSEDEDVFGEAFKIRVIES